ncbi:MAG TPA: hypothetical protein VF013_06255, partial [Candidatus Limnocylindria bacterium]
MSEPQHDDERYRWLQRTLEMVPGLVSWAIIIGPIWLSFSYPWLVAYFVLSFDFYWLCRALWFAGAVIVAYRRVRRVLATDWAARLDTLADPAARREELLRLLAARDRPAGALGLTTLPSGEDAGALRRELTELEALDALNEPPPDWHDYYQLALIPTYTESLATLRPTVQALADATWPTER